MFVVLPSPTHLSHYGYRSVEVEGFNAHQILNLGRQAALLGVFSMVSTDHFPMESSLASQGLEGDMRRCLSVVGGQRRRCRRCWQTWRVTLARMFWFVRVRDGDRLFSPELSMINYGNLGSSND